VIFLLIIIKDTDAHAIYNDIFKVKVDQSI